MCESGSTGLSKSREQEIQAELTRLLESPAFRTSKRCREFLEYIIEHTIRGPAGALKERSIGVELFQLAQDFDTGQHTIVRVTANEVRKKLAQHYQAENGSFHPVRIDLPPGSYSAAFMWGARLWKRRSLRRKWRRPLLLSHQSGGDRCRIAICCRATPSGSPELAHASSDCRHPIGCGTRGGLFSVALAAGESCLC